MPELDGAQPLVTPPFQLDDDNLSVRLNCVLDLRRPAMHSSLMLRYRVAIRVRNFLDEQRLHRHRDAHADQATPEGARDYLVPSPRATASSSRCRSRPSCSKQMLMVAGFDRYYQITKCFRDEDLRADRQPEFTQIDIGPRS